MAHWQEALPPDRFVEAEYEALVADPEPHARRLVAACGLEWNDACLAPHRNIRRINTASLWQARQPISRSSAGAAMNPGSASYGSSRRRVEARRHKGLRPAIGRQTSAQERKAPCGGFRETCFGSRSGGRGTANL